MRREIPDCCRNYLADTFQLEIVTPEKLVVNEPVEELQMPGADGYLGILPGHAPLITELAVGELRYRMRYRYTSHGGVLGIRGSAARKSYDFGGNVRASERDRRCAGAGSKDAPSRCSRAATLTLTSTQRALDSLHRAETRLEVARPEIVRSAARSGLVQLGRFNSRRRRHEASFAFYCFLLPHFFLFSQSPANQACAIAASAAARLAGQESIHHGDCVYSGRAQIGVVTSATRSPVLGKTIAFARIDIAVAQDGTIVEVGKLDGQQKRLPATIVPIPHFDPEKTRVRS